jgi:altronate dehydratase small subunit
MTEALILIDKRDNVATALQPLEQGASFELEVGGGRETVQALQPIPFGHKIALRQFQEGDAVVKYGEVIGSATKTIEKGEHVHTHNVEGPKRQAVPR